MRLLPILAALLLTASVASAETVRFATFNSSLSRDAPGELLKAMQTGDDAKAKAVAAIIQAARPDVLLLQEFDHGGEYDPDGEALRLFQQNYLGVAQQGDLEPIAYEHVYLAPSNTGLPTGLDLNGDGLIAPCEGAEVGTGAYAADCHGYGLFPGQYAFVILSKHPIDHEAIETFEDLVWRDLDGNLMPYVHADNGGKDTRRLSTSGHASVPVRIGETHVRVLAANPDFSDAFVPPFSGSAGARNHDEIALLHGMAVEAERAFVVAGNLGADRSDGRLFRYQPHPFPRFRKSEETAVLFSVSGFQFPGYVIKTAPPRPHAIESLLQSELIWSNLAIGSRGGGEAAERDGGVNLAHVGPAIADTADLEDERDGNLRLDYVLPSADLQLVSGGVFWPTPDEQLMGVDLAVVEAASDHRLVWVDVRVP